MSVRARIAASAASAGVAFVLVAASSAAPKAFQPCTGPLGAIFKLVPGSEGMGHVVYTLRVTNTSSSSCFVTGIPSLTLLDKSGKALPTHATFGGAPGTLTAVVVQLAPGKSAKLTARLSPDIPGPGEPQMNAPCEKPAAALRIQTSAGATAVARVSPPTPVCEHGYMSLTVFTH